MKYCTLFDVIDSMFTSSYNETKDAFTAKFNIAGTKKEDVEVNVRFYDERPYLHVKNSGLYSIPSSVDTKRITASYQDGMLTVIMNKKESSKGYKIVVD